MPSSARTRRRRVCSAEALRHRKQTDARCAPTKKITGWCFCRRRSVEAGGWAASGGGLFTAEKSPKRAGGCGPRSPVGPCGVHPKKRQLLGRYDPPNRPVPYCLPLPGFARASGIGWPLRLLWFSLRPHLLPRNRGLILHTAAFTYKYCRPDRRGGLYGRPPGRAAGVLPSNRPASGGIGPM